VNLGLDDKVALVCGASRGLGRAIADELAAEAATLALCSRDLERLEAVACELGPDVLAVPADLAVASEPTRVVEATLERFGRLDVLVTNTGGPPAGTHDTLTLEDWDAATALLLRSTVELATAALPGMKERGWGRILAVTSVAVKQPVDNLILSNSLRAAVTGYAKTLAREVAPHGVTVNTILPGYTATERVTELNRANAEREGVDVAEVETRLVSSIPLGRLAEPEEFAALAAFLASERAGYITGGAFAVDGGWLRGLL
jgi:3-oxoacyl-[acyl-carrier protein] reductase